jgi:hypothetical protein
MKPNSPSWSAPCLFREFAELDSTETEVLNFANNFGLLRDGGNLNAEEQQAEAKHAANVNTALTAAAVVPQNLIRANWLVVLNIWL